ncbi:MAG TPA: SDR family oxidoreductase [Candidatus Limnocylindrales bacterium]|nr:SDR family oxidoreductase [Candidatus Limnocylindrales bacterium]
MSYLDAFSLQGKVALVPGGGGAIGTAVSTALAGAGAKVVVANRTLDKADATAEIVRASGGQAIGVAADATSEEDSERAVAQALDAFGRLDIIVNCVGGGAGRVLHDAQEYPRDAWDWIMELNVRSVIVPTMPAVRAMIAAGNGGRVVNLSSVRAVLGINAGYSAYVAAKGAIESLTRQWATEWAKHGINVNAVRPTFVDTPQVASLLGDPAFKAGIVSRIPLGRVGGTDDITGAVVFLASPAASFITGQVLGIDGGLTATQ